MVHPELIRRLQMTKKMNAVARLPRQQWLRKSIIFDIWTKTTAGLVPTSVKIHPLKIFTINISQRKLFQLFFIFFVQTSLKKISTVDMKEKTVWAEESYVCRPQKGRKRFNIISVIYHSLGGAISNNKNCSIPNRPKTRCQKKKRDNTTKKL